MKQKDPRGVEPCVQDSVFILIVTQNKASRRERSLGKKLRKTKQKTRIPALIEQRHERNKKSEDENEFENGRQSRKKRDAIARDGNKTECGRSTLQTT